MKPVYIIKDCISKGQIYIIYKNYTIIEYFDKKSYLKYQWPRNIIATHYDKKYWTFDREEAFARAYKLREKKIKLLEKKLEKLKNLEFKINDCLS